MSAIASPIGPARLFCASALPGGRGAKGVYHVIAFIPVRGGFLRSIQEDRVHRRRVVFGDHLTSRRAGASIALVQHQPERSHHDIDQFADTGILVGAPTAAGQRPPIAAAGVGVT